MIQDKPFDLQRYKAILISTLRAFIEICEKNQLRYFCAGGTVLGAVRHHDMIPWDDDIDVCMPQADYERFLQLNMQMENNGYRVISAHNCNRLATFAKFYDANTTLWELKEIPFVYGIYIDIFPLYESSDTLDAFLSKYMKMRNAQRKYQLSQMRFSIKDIYNYYKWGERKYFYKGLLSIFFPCVMINHYRNHLIKCEEQFKGQKGDKMVCPYGEYFKKEYQEKSWFEEYAILPFGELQVRVPIGYDDFLKHVYGDYMQLPPMEKRVSHHYHYFLDMDKGMPLEEVKALLRERKE